MKKVNIIKKNEDFNRIISNVKPFKYKEFLIFVETKEENTTKFGFSVSKHYLNAVGRNKLRRQLKNIIDKKDYKNNLNCIIMVNRSVINKDFNELNEDLNYCFEKLNIWKEEINEK